MIATDSSLQRISFIMTVSEQIAELPKPCLLSAEEIALASSPGEIELFANHATANAMLTSLLEYETKLQRAFEKPEVHSIARDQSLVFSISNSPPHSTLHEIPRQELPPKVAIYDDYYVARSPPFVDLLRIEKNKIGGYSLLHPLINAEQFNGAISEIVHLAKTVQGIVKIYGEYELLPIPGHAMISFGKDRRKLWCDPKKPQSTEILSLQEACQRFLRLCWMLLAECKISESRAIGSIEEINFVGLLPNVSNDGQWEAVCEKVILMAKCFAIWVRITAERINYDMNSPVTRDLLVFDGEASVLIDEFSGPHSV
jgi:hypothetical protein